MPKQRHDTEATRAEIVQSARDAFATEGYTAARTEAIVERFGLTRGALYHHFGSKLGLFDAVLEDLQSELATGVVERALAAGPRTLDQLRAGLQTYLDVAIRPDVRQIVLIDGPAVVGWERWQEIDDRHTFEMTRAALEMAMAEGEIRSAPLDELTRVLLGAATRAALEIGRADDPTSARTHYGAVVDSLVSGLEVVPDS